MKLNGAKRSQRSKPTLNARRPLLDGPRHRTRVACPAACDRGMGKAVEPANFSDASLQILHVLHEVGDHAPSAILAVGDQRICFNCAEGFQRCAGEGQVCTAAPPRTNATTCSFKMDPPCAKALLRCGNAILPVAGLSTCRLN